MTVSSVWKRENTIRSLYCIYSFFPYKQQILCSKIFGTNFSKWFLELIYFFDYNTGVIAPTTESLLRMDETTTYGNYFFEISKILMNSCFGIKMIFSCDSFLVYYWRANWWKTEALCIEKFHRWPMSTPCNLLSFLFFCRRKGYNNAERYMGHKC